MSNASPNTDDPLVVAPDADLRALFNLPANAEIYFDTSGVTGLNRNLMNRFLPLIRDSTT